MIFSKMIKTSALSLIACSALFASNIKGPIVTQERLNPGLDVQVPLLPHVKNTNSVTYTVTQTPKYGTLYYDAVKIEEGFQLTDPDKITIDPNDGDLTTFVKYTETTPDGVVSEPRTIIIRFLDLTLSGSVLHDANGNKKVDGEALSNLDGDAIYINLVDKEEKVLSSKVLSEEGKFSFNNSDGLQPYTNYALVISTKRNALSAKLPENWGTSGESIGGQKKDKHHDGVIVVSVRDKDIAKVKFGLDIRPLAEDKTEAIQLNPGGKKQVTVPKLTGSDKEDGQNVRFFLLSLPENAKLYDKGTLVKKAGLQVKDPGQLSVDPQNSDQEIKFSYVSVDSAGVTSHGATVRIPFAGLKISGRIFNDGNGDGKVNGKTIHEIDGEKLYVTLFNAKDQVLASVSPDINGSYLFDGEQGIVPKSEYTLVLSTKEKDNISTLPETWLNSGEGIMSGTGRIDAKKDGKIKVKVNTTDLHEVDFDINKKPEATEIIAESQINPGTDERVILPPLVGLDNESTQDLVYTIESLPKNATVYVSGQKVTKVPFTVPDPKNVEVDPKSGEEDVLFTYLVTDQEGASSKKAKIKISFSQLTLSGHLFNDGNNDNNVSGTKLSKIDNKELFVLLLNTEKKVLSAKPIAKDGSYKFDGKDGVDPDKIYFLALATDKNVDAFGLPEGWNSTGEKINSLNLPKDDQTDGLIMVKVGQKNISNIDFGVNQKPVADAKTLKAQLNPGIDDQVAVPALTGSDRESGTKLTYTLTTLPKKGTLYYDGTKVSEAGFVVEETNKLTFDPHNGNQNVHFTYATRDEASVVSEFANVQMVFTELHLRGRVVDDGLGRKGVRGKTIKIPAKFKPYATLLDENNSILASNPLHRDGTFSFSGNDGIRPFTAFTIVVSMEANSSTPVLPSGWAMSGVGLYGQDHKKEAHKEGLLTVYMKDKDINSLTFGVNKKPTAEAKNVKSQINPGGKARVSVPKLSGKDRESGSHLTYRITKLPKNATLFNKNKEVAVEDLVDPAALTLNPRDGKQKVSFSYVSIDQEGIFSKPVKVRMEFTGLSISGSVFEDFMIDGQVDSAETISTNDIKLFVTLLTEEGEIAASVPVSKDGSYLFDESAGVNSNTIYRVVLSKDANATTSTLPHGWNYADGENVNALGKGNDGKADGMIDVTVREKDLKQVDFSTNYLIQ